MTGVQPMPSRTRNSVRASKKVEGTRLGAFHFCHVLIKKMQAHNRNVNNLSPWRDI